MLSDDLELQELRNRWSGGKYNAVLEALENVLPQEKWMDMCDAIVHPIDKKLANDLRGIRLCGKNLNNLDLGSSLLEFAIFDRSEFNEAHFQWSILTDASFKECKFHSVQMLPIFGERIDFSHAEFYGSHINHARIENCKFSQMVMRGGNLDHSNVVGGDFSGVLIEKGDFRWNDAQRCDFSKARFVGCDFTGSRINDGDLTGASFENCDLSGVDFRGVNLEGLRIHGGSFWSGPDELEMARTKFDDTPQARRAVAMSDTERRAAIEWCPVATEANAQVSLTPQFRLKAKPGEIVPKSGWWMSPALGGEQSRRYFSAGEKFPETEVTSWGLVVWHYNSDDRK